MAEQLEGSHAVLIATHDFTVDQAGPDLEMIHGLHDEGVAGRPVVALRVISRMPTGSCRAMSRKPSCLISWIQFDPAGGFGAGEGRHGSTKLARSAARRSRIRSIDIQRM